MTRRKNKNRGYQQLRVWSDAVQLYRETCRVLQPWPFELKRIAAQAMTSGDSVHWNIAEGYCRRSIREYTHYLYIALGSLGESVSGFHAARYQGVHRVATRAHADYPGGSGIP
jgi:four helix bundle protein